MEPTRTSVPTDGESKRGNSAPSPLSLDRLREAFAAMLNPNAVHDGATARGRVSPRLEDGSFGDGNLEHGSLGETALRETAPREHDPCEINPRSVVEAMLFVGRPDNRPLSAREMAAAMRGVSPSEIDAAVAELNALYQGDGAPYEITGSASGYQLVLREEFGRMRDKFYGRIREAKLSPAALEVLAIVAYKQPTTVEEINELRGTASGAVLSTLVRRKLVRLDRPEDRRQRPQYATTDRFLRLFGLESLAALPRSEELEKA